MMTSDGFVWKPSRKCVAEYNYRQLNCKPETYNEIRRYYFNVIKQLQTTDTLSVWNLQQPKASSFFLFCDYQHWFDDGTQHFDALSWKHYMHATLEMYA